MNQPFLCAMAVFDPKTEETITKMRRRLLELGFAGRQSKRLPPHITLGIYRPSERQAAEAQVRRAAENTKRFELPFRHIGIFSRANVLFLAPDRNAQLLALHSFFGPEEEFAPHVTLLSDKPASVYAAIPHAADEFRPFCGTVQAVRLYEFHPAALVCEAELLCPGT